MRWGRGGNIRYCFYWKCSLVCELLKVAHTVRSQIISMQAHQQEYHTFLYSFEFLSTQTLRREKKILIHVKEIHSGSNLLNQLFWRESETFSGWNVSAGQTPTEMNTWIKIIKFCMIQQLLQVLCLWQHLSVASLIILYIFKLVYSFLYSVFIINVR